MTIGILTFHSQLNYGGVLQCWALKKVLEQMGHDVFVVDRWPCRNNGMLLREFAALTVKVWAKLIVRGLLGFGDFGRLLRTIRTIRFVRALGLTKEHFCDWSEIKQFDDLSIEKLNLLVVGSDQVWHCGDWGDPRPYLLDGAPKIPAIAYAASFGMRELPAEMVDLYHRGLGRFGAISCREQEGVDICRKLGYFATHVADPTLLLDRTKWDCLVESCDQAIEQPENVLVCCFMSIDLSLALPLLGDFADRVNCRVKVLANDSAVCSLSGTGIRKFRHSRVKICREYGPKEFVRAFKGATWTLTDSFHAMMFSTIFRCDARFLRPACQTMKTMFSRIEEFSSKYIEGPFLVDDVAQALRSFENAETIRYDVDRIAVWRAASMEWLKETLSKVPLENGRRDDWEAAKGQGEGEQRC